MHSRQFTISKTFFLVFESGDEVLATIAAFAEKHQIRGGHFLGVGGLERAAIAWWNWTTKEYEKRTIDEQVEVLSLTGDVTEENGRVKVHAHTVLGRSDGQAVGGHVIEAHVRPMLELQLVAYSEPLMRKRNDELNLSVITFDQE